MAHDLIRPRRTCRHTPHPDMFAGMNGGRCLLFFPGSRPELLAKAVATGAGRVCVDLEDSVAPEDKARAREAVGTLLASDELPEGFVVRINHPDTPHGRHDLDAVLEWASSGHHPALMIPKAESPEDVAEVRSVPAPEGEGDVIPVIETARGLADVEAIASAPGVVALLFGSLDLSTDLGCALEWEPLLYARSRCVVAGRIAGIALIDTPFFDVDDIDGLRSEAIRARRLGFTAKAAIHPSQVGVIDDVFAPREEDIEWARRVMEAADQERGGVFLLDGVMVDAPMVEAARRLLAGVEASGSGRASGPSTERS